MFKQKAQKIDLVFLQTPNLHKLYSKFKEHRSASSSSMLSLSQSYDEETYSRRSSEPYSKRSSQDFVVT